MDAVNFSKGVNEIVNIRVNKYDDDFNSIVMLSEFGEFAYECRVWGKVRRHKEEEVNINDINAPYFYLELLEAYQDGEEVNLNKKEIHAIEYELNRNIDLEIYED